MLRITSLIFALLVSWSACAQVPLTGAGKGAPVVIGGPFIFQGFQFVSSLGSGTAVTYSVTTAAVAAGARVVVGVACTLGGSATITSAVYDPTGANITLTQDVFNNLNFTTGIYSGVVAGAIPSGSKNIVVTYSSNPQFTDTALFLWTITGGVTNQTGASGNANATISVTAGHYMVGVSFETGSAVDYGLSTQVPTTLNLTSPAEFYGPQWNTIAANNASFIASPSRAGVSVGGQISVATYH